MERRPDYIAPKPLSTRLVELAYNLKDADPELAAHLLVLDKMWREGKRRRSATRKVRLDGSGKAGVFWAPAKMVEEGWDR